ncbi:PAS domain-containing protein [Oscillochloris sp. ZM17-4]|uniref:PAS domain-containing hybrid sensor histidine kinase/response regulator n=1 Tax=Oscillochloris sp. ZM17-4 TaxID=2866714 RepID=UPI001C73863A|nr:PAS domain-containing protein [Oscillochloris sp. ZM17-4]MBX0328128.1 PAS domain-containing protein [Oscillochloris sp. ZM17-4]
MDSSTPEALEQLRAENARLRAALSASEERLELALDAAGLIAWEWDVATGALTYSAHVTRSFGIPQSYLAHTIDDLRAKIYPPDLPLVERALEATLRGSAPELLQLRIATPEGDLCWLELRGLAQLDASGQPVRVVGVTRDISAEQQLQADAQAAHQAAAVALAQLNAFVSSAPMGIAYLDHELRYQIVNPAMAAINQLTPADHLGRTPAEVIPYTAQQLEPLMRQVLATGAAVRDLELENLPAPLDVIARDWQINLFPVASRPAGKTVGVGVMIIDLSQQRRDEAALRASEQKLRTLIDILPVGISIFDAEEQLIYVNPAMERIMRMDRTGLLQGAHLMREYFRPDGTTRPMEELARSRVFRERQSVTVVENGFRIETGEVRWASVSAVPVDLPDWRAVIATTDITALKQAEDARSASEAHYRSLFKTMAQGVIYQDSEGRVIAANPAAVRILGLDLSRIQSHSVLDPGWEAFYEDGTPFPKEELPCFVALRTGHAVRDVVLCVTLPTSAGHRWLSIQAVPQFRPGETTPSQVYTMFADITAERDSARALEYERQQLAAIVSTMHEGVMAIQPDGAIALINAAGLRLADLTSDRDYPEMADLHGAVQLSRYNAQGQFLPSGSWPEDRLLRGESFVSLELCLRSADQGIERWLALNGTPVYDEHGTLILGVMTGQDITQRKQTEIALQAHTETLSRTNAELTRALRLKDEFLAMMSHELRTPLSVMLGISEAMEHDLYGPISPEQRQALGTLIQSGRHLLAILSDIMDLARIEAGHETLYHQPIDVDTLCQAALQYVQDAAQRKGVRMRRSVEHGVEGLIADERRLTQILVNLLDNAVKFTPAGGMTGLDVLADAGQAQIQFVVWDTGIGIAESDYARLFEPFTQVDGQLSRQYSGVGLGLALVRRLVDLHGGSICMESTLGHGCRFTVNMPWSEGDNAAPQATHAAAAAAAAAAAVPDVWAQPPKVVLVDDHEPTLTFYRGLLTARGCQVAVGRTGGEAVSLVREAHPDVAVLDIQMPGMDGLEAIRHIRADPALVTVPIIALTALTMPGDRERCLAAGANAYLAKPVSMRALIAAIGAVLSPTRVGEEPMGV